MGDLSSRIKLVVEESGLTKTEFGRRINLSQPTISNLMKGAQNPSKRTLIDIANKFDVEEEWIRTGEGPMRMERTREEELQAFFANVLKDSVPNRKEIILALSKMPAEWWEATSRMIMEAANAIKAKENPAPEE